MATIAHSPFEKPQVSLPSSTAMTAAGVALLILGVLALAMPWWGSLALELTIGWVLVIAGAARLIRAFQDRKNGGFWFGLLWGVFTVGVGFVLLAYPIRGVMALAWLLGIYLLASGILSFSWSFATRPVQGWGWLLVQGILNVVLGMLVLAGWPVTAIWVLGLFLGIDLVTGGFAMLAAGRAFRQFSSTSSAAR